MPATICEFCDSLMDFCYRFKKMCKEADTALQIVTTSRIWPEALAYPRFPDDSPFILMEQTQSDDPPEDVVEIINGNDMFAVQDTQISILPLPEEDAEEEPQPTVVAVKKDTRRISNKSIVVKKEEEAVETQIIPLEETETKAASIPIDEQPPIILNTHSPKLNTTPTERPRVKPSPTTKPAPVTKKSQPPPKVLNQELGKKTNKQIPANVTTIKIETAPEILPTDVFSCSSCSRSFPLKQLLDIHEKNHTRDRESACDLCPKKFFTKYDLAKHMLTHTGERPFHCVVCDKYFSRSTLLHRHQKIHTDVPRFECPDCDRFYFAEEELEKHAEKHKKARPFHCSFCTKSFAFKQGLERHETVHAESQPYPCQYCGTSFNTRNKLLRHLTAHAGNRPFPCKYCPKSYLLSHHLSRHMRSHSGEDHEIVVMFTCYRCQEEFESAEVLVEHMVETHTSLEDHSCPLCNERFETAGENRMHVQQHMEANGQFACEFCDLIFLDEDKLNGHSQEDHAEEQRMYEEDLANNARKEQEAAVKEVTLPKGGKRPAANISEVLVVKVKKSNNNNKGVDKLIEGLPKGMSVKKVGSS